jgi:(E)-4-hydroxy-3-methylbut-2-enyl-diphosphate synthase
MFTRSYKSHEVTIGNITLGGNRLIVVQSMTNTPTIDVDKTVAQTIRIIEQGGDLVRISTKNEDELIAFQKIASRLRIAGFNTPLIADIHFSASLALKAAEFVNKVRINPGNYYKSNVQNEDYNTQIENNLLPLVETCKKHNCAVRIGTNHGSLSQRIKTQLGTGPAAMSEATMEFVRVFDKLNMKQVVLSVKASNALENIHATQLLVSQLMQEGFSYPIHLGVTESGL